MKIRKMIVITAVILVLLFVTYVIIDCVRLSQAMGTKPLITVSEKVTDNRVIYYGLGYSIHYYVDIGDTFVKDDITYIEQLGHGAECRLFDRILLWAWIE